MAGAVFFLPSDSQGLISLVFMHSFLLFYAWPLFVNMAYCSYFLSPVSGYRPAYTGRLVLASRLNMCPGQQGLIWYRLIWFVLHPIVGCKTLQPTVLQKSHINLADVVCLKQQRVTQTKLKKIRYSFFSKVLYQRLGGLFLKNFHFTLNSGNN